MPGLTRLMDLVERMRAAFPPEVAISKAEWLDARQSAAAATGGASSEKGGPMAKGAAVPSALIPREVPSLPKGNMPRKAIIDGIKNALFKASSTEGGGRKASVREGATLLVQGMGGSGKTVVASSIARDSEIGVRFAKICFAGVGQDGGFCWKDRKIPNCHTLKWYRALRAPLHHSDRERDS